MSTSEYLYQFHRALSAGYGKPEDWEGKAITVAVVRIQHFTGALSVLGSSMVIFLILSQAKEKLKLAYNRIMLLLSFFDILFSAATLLSSYPSPTGTFYGARGNTATCSAQAFFVHIGLSVPMFTATLCIFFVLRIRYKISVEFFNNRIEPYLFAFAILYPLVTAIACLTLGVYGNIGPPPCWITEEKDKYGLTTATLIGLIIPISIISISMILLYYHIVKEQKAIRQYNVYGVRQTDERIKLLRAEKKEVATQATFVIWAFFITYLWPVMGTYIPNDSPKEVGYVVEFCQSVFTPLQGFWNFFIYIRPKCKRLRHEDPDLTYPRMVVHILVTARTMASSSDASPDAPQTPRTPFSPDSPSSGGAQGARSSGMSMISYSVNDLGEKAFYSEIRQTHLHDSDEGEQIQDEMNLEECSDDVAVESVGEMKTGECIGNDAESGIMRNIENTGPIAVQQDDDEDQHSKASEIDSAIMGPLSEAGNGLSFDDATSQGLSAFSMESGTLATNSSENIARPILDDEGLRDSDMSGMTVGSLTSPRIALSNLMDNT